MIVHLTRRERFNAAHRLFRKDWSDEKNFRVYGKCSNPNWHGHNYELFITVKGEMDTEKGYLIDLKEISRIIKSRVIDQLDHKNINIEVDFMKDKIASTENIAIGIWEQLNPEFEKLGIQLHRVKLMETENNYIEFFGS